MKHIAFDMDGTLYDCGGIIAESYSRAATKFSADTGISLTVPESDRFRAVLGLTADGFFKGLFPGLEAHHYKTLDVICTAELSADVRKKKGVLYDGVSELFKDLNSSGWKILIASNGQIEYLTAILETYDLMKYLEMPPVVVNYKNIVTKSDILAEYKKRLGKSEQFIMVGDRSSDLKAARDNAAFFIGCSFGHANAGEIEGADVTVHSVSEIKNEIEIL